MTFEFPTDLHLHASGMANPGHMTHLRNVHVAVGCLTKVRFSSRFATLMQTTQQAFTLERVCYNGIAGNNLHLGRVTNSSHRRLSNETEEKCCLELQWLATYAVMHDTISTG